MSKIWDWICEWWLQSEAINQARERERDRIIQWLRDRAEGWRECGPRFDHYASTCAEIATALERGEA